MRTSLILLGLALIPVFAWILRMDYTHRLQPRLRQQAAVALSNAGITGVNAKLDYFDASLTGEAPNPAMRAEAETLVAALPGIRVRPEDNRIRVQADLTAKLTADTVTLSGWLPGIQARNAIKELAGLFRPELKMDVAGIQLSPHVEIGEPVRIPEGPVPQCFQRVLEDLRLPASFSILRQGEKVIMKGTVPTEDLKAKLDQVAGNSPHPMDASRLRFNAHCTQPPFMEGDALATFAAAFLSSPSPGEFEINERRGPSLRAHATPAMLASWLTLLRPVTGAAKVALKVTEVPSAFHFPDYRPLSKISPEIDRPLRQLLRQNVVTFSPGSSEIDSTSALKIGMLAAAITSAGPDAQFIVAGYGDEQLEPGSTGMLRVQRTEAVRNRLVAHGIPEHTLESSLFNAVRPSGQSELSEDRRMVARRVELLVK
jgi:outer membrane protein OmpA-like peptidoglycan-associated protein